MTPCPAHASAAKVCEQIAEEFKTHGDYNAESSGAYGAAWKCAAAILADCQSSGCAARHEKGLELAEAARNCVNELTGEKNTAAENMYGLLFGLLADHLEGK